MAGDGRLASQLWMTSSATRSVMAALSADGTVPRFVGGCVRDAIMGRVVKDIDIATPDRPETVIEKLTTAGLKSVPTGLQHGTVTAIAEGQGFEVTTLRRDIDTDGRHAIVAYTDNWTEDAARRDLTINAIYCDVNGQLFDPQNGQADIKAGRVRFVGNAADRIREDVLRILRFFRFYAWYGHGAMDAKGLAACQKYADNIPKLSAERVSSEMLRLLAAQDPTPTIRLMVLAHVLIQVLPGEVDLLCLQRLSEIELTAADPDPLRRLFALTQPDKDGARKLAKHFRLSNAQCQRLIAMAGISTDLRPSMSAQSLRRILYEAGSQAVIDRLFVNQALEAQPSDGWEKLHVLSINWQPVVLPVQGQDVLDLGVTAGPGVGKLLRDLEQWWVIEDFQPDRQACLAELKKGIKSA